MPHSTAPPASLDESDVSDEGRVMTLVLPHLQQEGKLVIGLINKEFSSLAVLNAMATSVAVTASYSAAKMCAHIKPSVAQKELINPCGPPSVSKLKKLFPAATRFILTMRLPDTISCQQALHWVKDWKWDNQFFMQQLHKFRVHLVTTPTVSKAYIVAEVEAELVSQHFWCVGLSTTARLQPLGTSNAALCLHASNLKAHSVQNDIMPCNTATPIPWSHTRVPKNSVLSMSPPCDILVPVACSSSAHGSRNIHHRPLTTSTTLHPLGMRPSCTDLPICFLGGVCRESQSTRHHDTTAITASVNPPRTWPHSFRAYAPGCSIATTVSGAGVGCMSGYNYDTSPILHPKALLMFGQFSCQTLQAAGCVKPSFSPPGVAPSCSLHCPRSPSPPSSATIWLILQHRS
jgi:hypothetical protein